MAYYADLVTDTSTEAQGDAELDNLTPAEIELAREWLAMAGVRPPDQAQNPLLWPLRQALGVLANRRGGSAQRLGRVMAALLRELSAYLGQQHRRLAVQVRVAEAIRAAAPSVVVAHSLGSVVAYETLHANPDLKVAQFVTLGSPLAAPGAVFESLEPPPIAGQGTKPAGVTRWENYADLGDLVALPPRLGNRFPIDKQLDINIGLVDFHSLGSYLSHRKVAMAIGEHCQG